MRNSMQVLALIALVTAIPAFSGCQAPTPADRVRANFSPELDTTTRNFEQHRNMEARTVDLDTRGIWDDGARILLRDRPSRLSPYPVP